MKTPLKDRCDTDVEAAEQLGISLLSLHLLTAAGVPGQPVIYATLVETLAEVGARFNVSERTAAAWKARGMPGTPGAYPLEQIRLWRLAENEPPEELIRNNPRLRRRDASGDAFRAVWRYLRVQLPEAANAAEADARRFMEDRGADKAETDTVGWLVRCAIIKHFDKFILDEQQIEDTLAEVWDVV